MTRRGIQALIGVALATMLAMPAFAQDAGPLVRGGAALPQFRLSFPSLGDRQDDGKNLEVAVTRPNSSVFSFLFSPRAMASEEVDVTTGAARNSAAVNWNIFDGNRFYGGFGLGGSMLNAGTDDPLHRALTGAPTTMHGTLRFGYHLGDQQNLLLSFDHAQTPLFGTDHGELGENLHLGYGFRF